MSGAKMAKSTGNIASVADLLAEGVSPRALRYALIAVNYRQALEYSAESLAAAGAAIDRLDTLVTALGAYSEAGSDDPGLAEALVRTRSAFAAALGDDLGISAALAAVFDLARDVNRRIVERSLSTADAATVLAFLRDLDRVLAILPDDAALDADLQAIVDARAAARAAGDWATSDRLRAELAERGVTIEDTRDGQRWRLTGGGR
jgi:cysteinyl-tRNA synthetase